jgi:flagellar biosynthetic protein FliO
MATTRLIHLASHKIRLPRILWVMPLVLLAESAVAAESDALSSAAPRESIGRIVGSNQGNDKAAPDDALDFFGHQKVPAQNGVTPAPEAKQEIRRPEPVSPADKTGTTEARLIDRRGGSSASWRVADLFPLAGVLGLIALAALVFRRYLPSRRLVGHSDLLEVVARTPVSPKQSLVVVRVARRFLLLGISPDRVTTLCILDDAQSTAELMTEVASHRPDSSTNAFASSFVEEVGEFEESGEEDPALPATGHVRGLLEKVRQLKHERVA